MKIYVTHSCLFDFKKKLYEPIKSSEAYKKHTFIFPHDKSDVPANSFEKMKSMDIILSEVSFPSTGQGIELGWANILDKKIICIHRKGSKYSSSLSTICNEFVEYDFQTLAETIDILFNK